MKIYESGKKDTERMGNTSDQIYEESAAIMRAIGRFVVAERKSRHRCRCCCCCLRCKKHR